MFNACFSLTSFNKALVDKYLDIPYVEVSKPLKLTSTSFSFNSCRPNADTLAVTSWEDFFKLQPSPRSWLTFICSASWRKAGYPSSFTIGWFQSPLGLYITHKIWIQRARLKTRTRTFIRQMSLCFLLTRYQLTLIDLYLVGSTSLRSLALITCWSSPSWLLHLRLNLVVLRPNERLSGYRTQCLFPVALYEVDNYLSDLLAVQETTFIHKSRRMTNKAGLSAKVSQKLRLKCP